MNKIKITVDLKNSKAVLTRTFPNSKKQTNISQIEFIEDNDQFTITDVFTYKKYRRMGYASMLMYALMGVAKAEKKAIVLFALLDTLPLYQKCGFIPISKFDNRAYCGISLKVANLNPKKSFRCQIAKCDLVWIPPNMNDVSIYL